MDKFLPGSIISLRLVNFQSFEDVTFTFHPNLNFIIGPNGSGKSTLTNAIALITGGSAKTIGKSPLLSDYVKFGSLSASIEATIAGINGPVKVERTLRSTSKSSSWTLNGQATKEKQMKEFFTSLNINVESLCTFLPQERVSEFAAATPEDLFKELISLLKLSDIKNRISDLEFKKRDEKQVSDVYNQQKLRVEEELQRLEAEKNEAEEQCRLSDTIKLMKERRGWILYENTEHKYKEKKAQVAHSKGEKKDLEQKISEHSQTISNLESEMVIESVEDIKEYNTELEIFSRDLKTVQKKQEAYEIELKSLVKRKEENTLHLSEIRIPQNKPEESNSKDGEISRGEEELIHLSSLINEEQRKARIFKDKKQSIESAQQRASSHMAKRMEKLKSFHKHTFSAVSFINTNKDKFQDEIILPAFVELRLKVPGYEAEVETLLSAQMLTSFICKNRVDYERLIRVCKDTNKLYINVLTAFKESPPQHKIDVRNMGFDGYLIDFVDGPKETLEMLKVLGGFDKIPVAKGKINEALLRDSPFRKYIANGRIEERRTSRYKKDVCATVTILLKRSGLFTDSVVPRDYESELIDLRNHTSTVEKNLRTLLEDKEKRKNSLNILTKARSEARLKRQQYSILIEKRNILGETISRCKREISEKNILLKENKIEIRVRIQRLLEHFKNPKFMQIYKTYCVNKEKQVELHRNILSEKQDLYNCKERLSVLERNISLLKRDIDTLKQEIITAKHKLRRAFTEEENEQIRDFPLLITDLEGLISREQARLSFLKVDKTALQRYEEKRKKLLEVDKYYKASENTLENMNKEVKILREGLFSKLEVPFKKLNTAFSGYFKELGLKGKVELHPHTNINKTQLRILIEFREGAGFEVLKSTYQSGGEKSVATMVFLLSLIGISPAPFRIIDEINQGMDMVNERSVHRLLVREQKGQAFLVSPKVIPELEYSENMKIIVVFPKVKLDLEASMATYRSGIIGKIQ